MIDQSSQVNYEELGYYDLFKYAYILPRKHNRCDTKTGAHFKYKDLFNVLIKLHFERVREHCKSILNGELIDLFDKTNTCKSIDFASTARNYDHADYNIVPSNERIHKLELPKTNCKFEHESPFTTRHKRNLSTRIRKSSNRELIITKSGLAFKYSSTHSKATKQISKVVLKNSWSNFICPNREIVNNQ